MDTPEKPKSEDIMKNYYKLNKATADKRYLRGVDKQASNALDLLCKSNLNFDLIGANFIKLVDYDTKEEAPTIQPESYITIKNDKYVIYIQFGHFWIFDGVQININKINEDGKTYCVKHYADNYINISNASTPQDIAELIIEQLKDIDNAYNKQYPIQITSKSDTEYTQRKRKIKNSFYYR